MGRQLATSPAIRPAMAGFSLVELLTVIGIVVLLVALLLPALGRTREHAQRVQCAAKLRQVGMAAMMHANEHRGYLPAAGWHWNCVGGVCDPHGLEDDGERKYDSYLEDGIKRPLPITLALGHNLNFRCRADSRQSVAEDLAAGALRVHFRCPSQRSENLGWSQRGDEGGTWSTPEEFSGYSFNAALLGRRDYNTAACPKGRLSKVVQPSKVFFALDGRPRDKDALRYLQIPDDAPDQTLSEVQHSLLTKPNGAEALDFARHAGRMNVVFCDWHVETVAMGVPPEGGDGLKQVYVSRGIAY